MHIDMRIDMHLHSFWSDGAKWPDEVAEQCKSAGLTHACLTDHDNIAGVADFLSAAGKRGIHAISGVELNISHFETLHMLVYGFDITDSRMSELLINLKDYRKIRIPKMLQKLCDLGCKIDRAELDEISGGNYGRLHLALLLVKHGYCKSREEAFDKYLAIGCPAYIPGLRLELPDALEAATKAGGTCVLAHPVQMPKTDIDGLFAKYKKSGLVGLEVYYPEHSDEQIEQYLTLAKRHDLLITCGSDSHSIDSRPQPGSELRTSERLQASVQEIFGKSCKGMCKNNM